MIGGVLNAGGNSGGSVKGAKIVTVQLQVDADGNIIIPYAAVDEGDGGAVRVRAAYGTMINASGQLYIAKATDALVEAKANLYRPIVPANLDLAIKAGLMTNAAITTDAERKAICETIGALFGVKRIAVGTVSITQNTTTVDISGYGFTSVPKIVASYSNTSTWSGDEGVIKIQSKTATSFTISIGGTGHTTPRPVDWIALEMV